MEKVVPPEDLTLPEEGEEDEVNPEVRELRKKILDEDTLRKAQKAIKRIQK